MRLIIAIIAGVILMRKHGIAEMVLIALLIWGVLSLLI